ncbi:hypothetical protein [Nocardia sp. NPDC052566]|uniref:hypothetical protein n=1 Tax=Nocardia sp. NPDC052566 TaxID=3364330 RepID=UPI0037C55019
MSAKPTALGYLRRDVSGMTQPWDESRMRGLAKRLGYELTRIVIVGPGNDDPETQLVKLARNSDVDAVLVPSAEHFGGDIPAVLVRVCDVITVSPETTYARWAWSATGEG